MHERGRGRDCDEWAGLLVMFLLCLAESFAHMYIPCTTRPHLRGRFIGFFPGRVGALFSPFSVWVSSHEATRSERSYTSLAFVWDLQSIYIHTHTHTDRQTHLGTYLESESLSFIPNSDDPVGGALNSRIDYQHDIRVLEHKRRTVQNMRPVFCRKPRPNIYLSICSGA